MTVYSNILTYHTKFYAKTFLFYKVFWIFYFLLKENAIFCTPFEEIVSFWHLKLEQNSFASKKGEYHHGRLPGVQLRDFILYVWMPWAVLYCKITAKSKNRCCSRGIHKLWGYWQEWSPTTVRRRPWPPWGPHFLQFLR